MGKKSTDVVITSGVSFTDKPYQFSILEDCKF